MILSIKLWMYMCVQIKRGICMVLPWQQYSYFDKFWQKHNQENAETDF